MNFEKFKELYHNLLDKEEFEQAEDFCDTFVKETIESHKVNTDWLTKGIDDMFYHGRIEDDYHYVLAMAKFDKVLAIRHQSLAEFEKGNKELGKDKAKREIQLLNELCQEIEGYSKSIGEKIEQMGTIFEVMSDIYMDIAYNDPYDIDSFLNARTSIILALEDSDKDLEEELKERFNNIEDFFHFAWSCYKDPSTIDEETVDDPEKFANLFKFTNLHYSDRRLILFPLNIGGCTDKLHNINWIFTLKNYPPDITFPNGHPRCNELYIAHPFKTNYYIPFIDSEYTLFIEKIEEFSYIMECLGATEINYTTIHGKSVKEISEYKRNIQANVDYKIQNINANYSTSTNKDSSSSSNYEFESSKKLNPSMKPFLPDNLLWYPKEERWQNIVNQRLKGNLLELRQKISTSETKCISQNETSDIKLSYNNLMLKASVNYQEAEDKTFDSKEDTEWEIKVIFKPIGEQNESNIMQSSCSKENSNLCENLIDNQEIAYKKEILFCLEDDGIIDEQERKFLERKRIKLSISKERAKEIEEQCKPNMTENEKEYVEAIKEGIDNGSISDSARRLLERERKSLGISEERAKELEINLLQ